MPRFTSFLIDFLFPPHKDVLKARSIIEGYLLSGVSPQYTEDSNTYTALSYKNPDVRALIKANKFYADRRAAKLLGSVLNEMLVYVLEEYALTLNGKPILAPIPSSKKRRRERGGNQVEKIIEALPKETLESFEYRKNLLARHERKSQTHVPRHKREENIKEAFHVNRSSHKPTMINHSRLVILVDDVSESGATMRDAMRALKEGGAGEVVGIAIAK